MKAPGANSTESQPASRVVQNSHGRSKNRSGSSHQAGTGWPCSRAMLLHDGRQEGVPASLTCQLRPLLQRRGLLGVGQAVEFPRQLVDEEAVAIRV